jgi:hypothetical protein
MTTENQQPEKPSVPTESGANDAERMLTQFISVICELNSHVWDFDEMGVAMTKAESAETRENIMEFCEIALRDIGTLLRLATPHRLKLTPFKPFFE